MQIFDPFGIIICKLSLKKVGFFFSLKISCITKIKTDKYFQYKLILLNLVRKRTSDNIILCGGVTVIFKYFTMTYLLYEVSHLKKLNGYMGIYGIHYMNTCEYLHCLPDLKLNILTFHMLCLIVLF